MELNKTRCLGQGLAAKIRIYEIMITCKEIGLKLLPRGIVKSPLLEILRIQLDEFLRNLSRQDLAQSKGLDYTT